MRVSGMVTNLLLFAILSNVSKEEQQKMTARISQLYQPGSCGDGAFDTAVRRAFNDEVSNAIDIVNNPYTLVTD